MSAGAAPLVPGKMYLHLFHGREAPDEVVDDWGFDGPHIGPLDWYHTTYHDHIRYQLEAKPDNAGTDLKVVDGLVEHEGKFYGDWSVYVYRGEVNACAPH